MKACKTIFNILGILFAIIFSVITLLLLPVIPLVSTCTTLLQPDTIQEFLQDMHLSEQLESTLKNSAPSDLQSLDMKFIDDLMASELMEDIIQLYLDNLFDVLESDHMENINQQQIQTLLDTHTPSLVSMIRPYLPTELPITDDDISKYAKEMLEPALTTMISSLPTLEDMGIDQTRLTMICMLYNGTFLKYSIIIIAILSLLVFLCRFPRFKGFMWLGVIYLFFTVILLILASDANRLVHNLLSSDIENTLGDALQLIIELTRTQLYSCAGIMGLLGVLFIVLFLTIRNILSRIEKNTTEEFAA